MFHTNVFEYDAAKENCEKKYYGKLLELDENVPDILKNVYDSDTTPAWVANKVNLSYVMTAFCVNSFRLFLE